MAIRWSSLLLLNYELLV